MPKPKKSRFNKYIKNIFDICVFLIVMILLFYLGFGVIKLSRDQSRIRAVKFIEKKADNFIANNGTLFVPKKDPLKFLLEEEIITLNSRDPRFKSKLLVLDKYFFKFREKIAFLIEQFTPQFSQKIPGLKNLPQEFFTQDFVIVCLFNGKDYEVSVKLESKFYRKKMKEDQGNDNGRYEVGTNLSLNTALRIKKDLTIEPYNPRVVLIR